jgi:hypothetical protein
LAAKSQGGCRCLKLALGSIALALYCKGLEADFLALNMPNTPILDTQSCPICGKPNQCAAEVEKRTGVTQPPCWCTQVDFNAALLTRIPPAAVNKACVCHHCATRD